MEDSLNYMNAVSEASQALNQVSALRQEAEMQFQQKKEQLGQELQLPSEISITSAGAYLGKKALGYVGEKFGSTISEAASKVGISEDTVGRALSGDITGALEQGAGEVSQMAEGIVGGAISEAQGLVGGAVSEAQGIVGGIVGQAEGILGRVSSGLENIPTLNIPSISPEIDIGNLYSQGLEDLRAQAGIDENMFREYSNISLDNIRQFSFNRPISASEPVEMTDFSTIGDTSAEAATTGAEAATTGAEAGAEAVGTTVAETAGEVAGAEAVGAGLDATGILAPIGGLIGLIGGLVGFFEGSKQESETMPVVPTPILNPSSQFL